MYDNTFLINDAIISPYNVAITQMLLIKAMYAPSSSINLGS